MNGWSFSKHALSRAVDMAVDPHELVACLTKPELAYEQIENPAYLGHMVYVAGRLAVVVDPDAKRVVTVLWHREKGRSLELCRDRRVAA